MIRNYCKLSLILLALLLLILPGCGDDFHLPPFVDATGTWRGTYTANGISQTLTLTLFQEGDSDSLSGSFSITAGRSGSVFGEVRGNEAKMTFFYTLDGCNGSYRATGDIHEHDDSPDTMKLSFSSSAGESCGAAESRTVFMIKD
jgi:hypothetical protein